jgi:hypothetical protein
MGLKDEGNYALYSSEYDWENSSIGYYLEVDLLCPEDLHDKFSAYPLFPEKREGKLMGTLYPKEHYISHIMNLRFGLKLSYKILKIHRVLRFRQEPFMREYIDHMANERKKYPKGTFLNEFYNLLGNSLFGKTCENPEKYGKFKFVRGYEKALKLFNTMKVKNFLCIDKINNVVLMEMRKNKVLYNRPLPIGVTILEISKWYMQRFYYEVMKPFYGDRMKFLYTDTDSLVLELQTEDFKKDIRDPRLAPHFESETIKGLPGYMKIEKDNILEFRAFCPKHYYYIQKINNRFKFSETFKGIPSNVREKMSEKDIEEHLKKNIPIEKKESQYKMKNIRSKKHTVFVMNMIRKVKDDDSKRYYLSDGIHALAFGHYKAI